MKFNASVINNEVQQFCSFARIQVSAKATLLSA